MSEAFGSTVEAVSSDPALFPTKRDGSGWAPEAMQKIHEACMRKLPVDEISERLGPRRQKVYYVEGGTAISLANEVFKVNGWNNEIRNISTDYCFDDRNMCWHCGVTALMRVTLADGTYHEDIGFGSSISKNRSEAISHSKKAAVTDALKRTLRLFGDGLGNCVSKQKKQAIEDERRRAQTAHQDQHHGARGGSAGQAKPVVAPPPPVPAAAAPAPQPAPAPVPRAPAVPTQAPAPPAGAATGAAAPGKSSPAPTSKPPTVPDAGPAASLDVDAALAALMSGRPELPANGGPSPAKAKSPPQAAGWQAPSMHHQHGQQGFPRPPRFSPPPRGPPRGPAAHPRPGWPPARPPPPHGWARPPSDAAKRQRVGPGPS